ncbi:CRTAC1 family protein [Rhodobacteraceae bacterium]|nr:CRTAC1 family protein [Paracoccaceae bacterium]
MFSDLSGSLPIQHVYDGGWEFYVGGGVAVFDCNNDGYPDIFAAGGAGASQLFLNQTPAAGEAITFAVAKPSDHTLNDVIGAYPIDINGDGNLDLFVMRVGPNAVLSGLGDCAFERAEDAWRIDPGNGWTTAFSAGWGAGDDWPTLAVGNYVDRRDPDGPFGTCDYHQIFRPNESGFGAPELITQGYCTLSMLFTDWSGSGQQDLWISNDRHYYVNDGQEQLIRVWPELSSYDAADGWATSQLWGMGIASRDITGDARPEIAITSMADQKLFQLDEDVDQPSFTSIAYDRGTTAHVPYMGEEGRPSTGWHVQFGDVDNDGLDDLFIAKGNVNQMPGMATRDPDNLLMQQQDGKFIEAGEMAGIGSFERGRGGALVDLNRDGLLDLVVVQRRAELKLYQNTTGETGNWVQLRLSRDGGNRNAIGARIEIMSGDHHQFREVQVGGGHAGGQAGFEHFGLATATSARLRVRWPDGTMGPWHEVSANTHLHLKAGAVPVTDGRTGGAQTPPAFDQ